MKSFTCFVIALLIQTLVVAQAKSDTLSPRIFFSSYIGNGSVTTQDSHFSSGFLAMTGLEYRVSKHSSFTGNLSVDSYTYQNSTAQYTIDGGASNISLSVFYKYIFATGRWQPYVRAGGGGARVTIPVASVKTGFFSIQNESKLHWQTQLNFGLNYAVTKRYLLSGEIGKQVYQPSAILQDKSLKVTAVRIGISTAL